MTYTWLPSIKPESVIGRLAHIPLRLLPNEIYAKADKAGSWYL